MKLVIKRRHLQAFVANVTFGLITQSTLIFIEVADQDLTLKVGGGSLRTELKVRLTVKQWSQCSPGKLWVGLRDLHNWLRGQALGSPPDKDGIITLEYNGNARKLILTAGEVYYYLRASHTSKSDVVEKRSSTAPKPRVNNVVEFKLPIH